MKISVIVPVYNAEVTIKRCLDSIINQSYKNIEIIVINDGSKDNTRKILEEIKLSSEQIIIFNKENGGVSSARNKGLELCTGDFLIFIDSDDYIDNDYIDKLFNLINSENIDIALCGIKYENNNGKLIREDELKSKIVKCKNDIGEILDSVNKSVIYGKMYKTNIIKNNSIKFDEKFSLGEDTLFVLEYLYHVSNGIGIIDNNMYHYVDANTESLSKKYHSDIKEIYEKIYNVNYMLTQKFSKYKIPYSKEVLIFTMEIRNMYVVSSKLTKVERISKIKEYMNDTKIRSAFKQSKFNNKIDLINKYLILFKLAKTMDFIYSIAYKIGKS